MFSTVFLVLVMSFKLNCVNCVQKTRTWIRWDMADVTFGTPATVQGSFTVMECLERCERSDSCVSAHVNKDSSGCEFSKYYPLHGNLVPEPRQGWRVYYRGIIFFHLICNCKIMALVIGQRPHIPLFLAQFVTLDSYIDQQHLHIFENPLTLIRNICTEILSCIHSE